MCDRLLDLMSRLARTGAALRDEEFGVRAAGNGIDDLAVELPLQLSRDAHLLRNALHNQLQESAV